MMSELIDKAPFTKVILNDSDNEANGGDPIEKNLEATPHLGKTRKPYTSLDPLW